VTCGSADCDPSLCRFCRFGDGPKSLVRGSISLGWLALIRVSVAATTLRWIAAAATERV
jgi:hypothetical protein